MGGMPKWFAKTREMAAIDLYFSLQHAGSEADLEDRYLRALARLGSDYVDRSDALKGTGWKPSAIGAALGSHFVGDWIHQLYPTHPAQYAQLGGRFWPQVGSQKVVERIRLGTTIAFHKALGRANLTSRGVGDDDIQELFESEFDIDVEVDGVLPLAMSWNCVAPTGEDYFEVDALRGPTVVELAIATPRPYGHGSIMRLVEEYELGMRQVPQISSTKSKRTSGRRP
jgi:hypothetical protein